MIIALLLFQLNPLVIARQAREGVVAAQTYTAHEMDTSGRGRLRTESLTVLTLVEELAVAKEKLRSCNQLLKTKWQQRGMQ